jgi:hypothetical protein
VQVQLTITLALIAGAAAVALICDFLRARNAQLRRAMAELEARDQARDHARKNAPKKANRPVPVRAIQRLAQPQNKDHAMTSKKALSEWLIQRAAARAAKKTEEETIPAVLKPFAVPARPVPVCIDAYLWAPLTATEPEPARIAPTFELIQGASKLDLDVPAGMHVASALERLTRNRHPFTGLVISIGVNQSDAGRSHNEELMRSIETFIAGLLGEADFGCHVDDDEFVLLCPGPSGAEAQRRLSRVSERLWDFQLRTLGNFSLLFSIGATDVERESLSDAIALAKERMGQTLRGRKPLSLSVVPQHRKAV